MTDGYVVLRVSDVEALMEEWGDLDQDPFWRPQSVSYRCRDQGMALPSAPCGFHHEGECVVEVRRPVPEPATGPCAVAGWHMSRETQDACPSCGSGVATTEGNQQ